MSTSLLQDVLAKHPRSFFLIAGPCAVESKSICAAVAGAMKEICNELEIPYIFKSSFKKANRTSVHSFKGIGDEIALDILREIKTEFGVPVTTDIHETEEVQKVAEIVDLLQIPAFLSRQTELLLAAGKSGLPVNIKKGQFLSAGSMAYAIEKVRSVGGHTVFLTERGTFFGYEDLVVDPRNISEMAQLAPTIIDVTHVNQKPNQTKGVTGGVPGHVSLMAKVGMTAGASGIFLEVHPDPSVAQSDGSTMIALREVRQLLTEWKRFYHAINDTDV